AFMRPPRLLHAMRMQVALQSDVDDVGGKHQGHLPQRGAPLAGSFRRRIDNHDFIRPIQKLARNRLSDALARETLDRFALVVDVLQIHGTDDGDPRVQQLLDVLPAVSVAATRRVVVRQPVDQADLGPSFQDFFHVDHRYAFDTESWHNLERTEQRLYLRLHL